MKRIIIYAIIVVLFSLAISGFVACKDKSDDYRANSLYSLSIDVAEQFNKVNVDMTATIVNNSDDEWESLLFSFYPDAFDLDTSPPVADELFDKAYPYGINAGDCAFEYVKGENISSYSVCDSEYLIEVKLNSPLSPKQSTDIQFKYSLSLPLCNLRYGYNETSINLTMFYPMLCYYGDSFVHYPYSAYGDPFVFDCADYTVNLTIPEQWGAVAPCLPTQSTAQENADDTALQNANQNADTKTLYYNCKNLRDFSLFISTEENLVQYDENGIQIMLICQNYDKTLPDTAVNALKVFSTLFSDRQDNYLGIVCTPFVASGMEYSNIIVLDDSLSGLSLQNVLIHEVAHQWWYHITGSDQYLYPWQDEMLAQWSIIAYYRNCDMSLYADTLLKNYSADYNDYILSQTSLGEQNVCDISRSLTEYKDNYDYTMTVYLKSLLAFELISQTLGFDKTCELLKEYCTAYSYKTATPQNLFDVFDKYNFAGVLLKNALASSMSAVPLE